MSDHHNTRYDRQLRIWGAHGQRRLESARICVINSGPTSSEALKNLVLGGIHFFTLVDDSLLTEADFGNNYLVDIQGLGNLRAPTVACLLKELNDSVAASVITDSISDVLAKNPDFFKDYSMVIATQRTSSQAKSIAQHCERFDIPFISVRSYGLLGYLQIFVKEVCVVESKPEDQVPDLRLGIPWSGLMEFANSFNFEDLEDVQHSHLPYVIILLKAMEIWKKMNEHTIPETSSEKDQFKRIIDALRRSKKNQGIEEENFDEALRAAYQVWTPYSIRISSWHANCVSVCIAQSVRDIMDDSKTILSQDSIDFWILTNALKRFVDETQCLPLNGGIPDMTSMTEYYLKLQEVYHHKAHMDIEKVTLFVKDNLQSVGRSTQSITPETISLFCKNVRNLRVVRSRPQWKLDDAELISKFHGLENFRDLAFAILLEGVDLFYEKHARYPGLHCGEDWMQDIELLMNLLLSSDHLRPLDKELKSELRSMAHEVCRWGASELHAVAAIMGGMSAQEAIKVLMQQFVPLSGYLLYNGVDSTTSVLP